MKDILFTADLHFSHYNIVLHCNRKPWIYPNPNYDPNKPSHFKFNNPNAVHIKEHDESLIANWNNIVKSKDTVYVLGDFAFQNHNHYLMALNGKKILIIGNHDKMSQEVYRNFTEVHEFGCKKRIEGYDITMSHYGLRTWPGSFHGSYAFYGHSHGRLPEFNNMLCCDVGIDIWGYAPVPWECLLQKMALKEEWIKKNGKYPVDGESRADGQYDKDPEERVIETRQNNKSVVSSINYTIDPNMW